MSAEVCPSCQERNCSRWEAYQKMSLYLPKKEQQRLNDECRARAKAKAGELAIDAAVVAASVSLEDLRLYAVDLMDNEWTGPLMFRHLQGVAIVQEGAYADLTKLCGALGSCERDTGAGAALDLVAGAGQIIGLLRGRVVAPQNAPSIWRELHGLCCGAVQSLQRVRVERDVPTVDTRRWRDLATDPPPVTNESVYVEVTDGTHRWEIPTRRLREDGVPLKWRDK